MDLSAYPNIIIAAVYYVLVGIMVFFSLFGVYVLNRYGQSKMLSLFASGVYIVFFLILLSTSYNSLQQLL